MSEPTFARANTAFSAVGAFAGVVVVVGSLSGWMTGPLRETISHLSVQVENLAAKVEQGPRLDQLQTMNGRIAGLEGRAVDMDTRVRADEERLTRTEIVADVNSQANKTKHP